MAVSDFEFNHQAIYADSFSMQSIIQEQHVAKRQRGLRNKAESIRMSLDLQLKNQKLTSDWRFLEKPELSSKNLANSYDISDAEQGDSSKHSVKRRSRFSWIPEIRPLSFLKRTPQRFRISKYSKPLETNYTSAINHRTFWNNTIEHMGTQMCTVQQAPFLIGLVYFFLVLFAFQTQVTDGLHQLTHQAFTTQVQLPILPTTRELRTYAAYQGDQGLSFVDFQSIDSSRFQKMTTTEYVVRSGDTLSGIALRFGLNMDTIISFNTIPDVRRMQVGQRLIIPSRDGLRYQVQRGDSLESIAQRNNTTVNALLDANDLSSDVISVGTSLFIPNARLSSLDLAFAIGEVFIYPTVGRFTSGFGFRPDPFTGQRRFHNGIDIANSIGTPVRASMAGRVVHIESQVGNYGKFIIIQHARGFQTLYAHLDSFAVSVGQYVNQGQLIARMGNTGRSTGPHLHFSIIQNGNFVDPLRFVRRP
jgi:murein DD-endopeptidase MepM/ murein hydrolase activator NlpD